MVMHRIFIPAELLTSEKREYREKYMAPDEMKASNKLKKVPGTHVNHDMVCITIKAVSRVRK
jgi:hypothetical protein